MLFLLITLKEKIHVYNYQMETTTSQKELELCKENLRVDVCATYPKDWNGDFNKYFIHFRYYK